MVCAFYILCAREGVLGHVFGQEVPWVSTWSPLVPSTLWRWTEVVLPWFPPCCGRAARARHSVESTYLQAHHSRWVLNVAK